MRTPEEEFFEKLSARPPMPDEPERELHKGAPDISKPVTLRNLFTNSDAHPLVIDYSMTKAFGEAWYGWAAETLWAEVKETFSTQISELARAKVRAMQVLRTSPFPWDSWQVFEKTASAVTGTVPNFFLMQKPSLDQIFAAVDIFSSVREVSYSSEVRVYIAAVFLENDVFYAPPPLEFAQLDISQPYVRCLDCGMEEPALTHDGFCSSCTERMAPEQGMSLEPKPELVKAGLGRNLKAHVRYPPDAVKARWEEIGTAPPEEAASKLNLSDEADVQVLKLLVARDFMNQKRKLLAEQLTTLKSWLGAS